MGRISEATKIKEHRGEGILADYKPWITIREFMRGRGTRAALVDPMHGRIIHLLSQNEVYAYILLRFSEGVTDIREQFPLDLDATNAIADRFGFERVAKGKVHMTTDLLVTLYGDYERGLVAYSVKDDLTTLRERDKQIAVIEKTYWAEKGVPFRMIDRTDLDIERALNLRKMMPYYDLKNVMITDDALLMHAIIRGLIDVDLSVVDLDFREIRNRKETQECLTNLKNCLIKEI